jgi:uncharacterized lipoprotein YddW (UPF0748 family)
MVMGSRKSQLILYFALFFCGMSQCKQTIAGSIPKTPVPTPDPKPKESPGVVAQATKPKTGTKELRALWMTNTGSQALSSAANTKEALQKIQKAGFNTAYVVVWNKGYTLYPSDVAQKATGQKFFPGQGLEGRDLLAEMIQETKSSQLEIVPWFEYGLKTLKESPLAQRNPDWFLKKQDGSLIEFTHNTEFQIMNPSHPQVKKFIVDLAVECVKKYEVSSIQFDDHFAIGKEFGYQSDWLLEFKNQAGGTAAPPPDNPEWVKFRANKVTSLFREVVQAVRAARPGIKISHSPNPHGFAFRTSQQDWATWVREGLVDELVVQLYRDSEEALNNEIASPELQEAKQKIPVSIGLYSGRSDKKIPVTTLESQAKFVRSKGLAGFAFFFYESVFHISPDSPQERIQKLGVLMAGPSFAP